MWTQMKIIYSLIALLMFTHVTVVNAADLSGEYHTTESDAPSILKIEQTGSLLKGSLQTSDWSIEFAGSSDGSNMANVAATLKIHGRLSEGFMILRRHVDGIQASVIIKSNREVSGQYHFMSVDP